jgi:hypothetical protein
MKQEPRPAAGAEMNDRLDSAVAAHAENYGAADVDGIPVV